ncbi:C_GCAxxG_C_C family protein [Geofilum rubicundum JCM 15548]|uniref:C_GCAxxG_C_C family protein n=1 Tax=Geofilum rubicundum JCM 15548 TaxID=1236989 RepID=A0A0E9LXQ6_9BACT|nr:C-GCAxxG-C-C family protein [Geofilum rubicundum]GAO29655.1 C_GCAxxG_C_C family protein [Geofilum rubicundum JCM 15548]
MDDKVMQDKAVSLMDKGFNCSQSVLSAYSEVLGFDKELALGVSCGFGAGMGRLQGTCGAVTGAIWFWVFIAAKSIRITGRERPIHT